MPLSWVLSNLMLLVIFIVFFSLYGVSYYILYNFNCLNIKSDFFVILWW